jgi:hypothetical protein
LGFHVSARRCIKGLETKADLGCFGQFIEFIDQRRKKSAVARYLLAIGTLEITGCVNRLGARRSMRVAYRLGECRYLSANTGAACNTAGVNGDKGVGAVVRLVYVAI